MSKTINDIHHHRDFKIAHIIIKKTSAKNINGKTSPGKAKNQSSPVLTNGQRHVIRYETITPAFNKINILFKNVGLPAIKFVFKKQIYQKKWVKITMKILLELL
jgi:hypothetical protein